MHCAALVPRAPARAGAVASRTRRRQLVAAKATTPKRKQPPPAPASNDDRKHVVIVGGGAAGLTAAIFAAREAAACEENDVYTAAAADGAAPTPPRVTVLERTSEPGKKILLSGGARANVLPLAVTPEADFSTDSRPSALRSCLAAWPLDEIKSFLERDVGLGPLALEVESAKYFPASDSARDVRDGLVRAAARAGAEVRCGVKVSRVERTRATADGNGGEGEGGPRRRRRWRVWIEGEQEAQGGGGGGAAAASPSFIDADSVVLACGGSSFPKVGTDGMGYRMLARLGVPLRAPYPALTPLVGAHPAGEQLAGVTLPEARLTAHGGGGGDVVAAEAVVAAEEAEEDGGAGQPNAEPKKTKKKKKKKAAAPLGASRRGGFLFSHRGYTGPAVLDVSQHWVRGGGVGGGGGGGNDGSDPDAARTTTTPAPTPTTAMRVAWTGEGEEAWAERIRTWRGGAHVATLLQRSGVPQRLAAALCREARAPEDGAAPASSLPKEAARELARLLGAYPLPVEGHRGYALAEVTGGGVPLEALDTRTMEVVRVSGVEGGGGGGGKKKTKAQQRGGGGGSDDDEEAAGPMPATTTAARSGLHVCGELVDVHGRIGGFNFLWAWVSGRSAGKGAVASALGVVEGGGGAGGAQDGG